MRYLLSLIFMVISLQCFALDSYTTKNNHTGYRQEQGNITILNLHGSYYEMGEQYGALAKDQLQQINNNISPKYFNSITQDVVNYTYLALYSIKITDREKQILQGMASTSGLSYYKLLKVDILSLLAGASVEQKRDWLNFSQQLSNLDKNSRGHCSFISAWGDKTSTNSMLVGRNLDLPSLIRDLTPYDNLVIYQPTNGDNKVATFSFMGNIPGFTWVNNKGLFAEYNDGRSSVAGLDYKGILGTNLNYNAMFVANTPQQFTNYLKSSHVLTSNITAIVDSNQSIRIENPANYTLATPANQDSTFNFFTNLYQSKFMDNQLTTGNCLNKSTDTFSFACHR
ncbi:MAG: hypothetical protein RLZZ293_1171, partial [Pseudomonadota bacterium]